MPLTFDDLNRIIQQGENATVEFKEEPSPDVMKGLSTDIAALANYQGGMIVFGVTDERDPKGCELEDDIRDRITTEAKLCRPVIAIDFEEISLGKRRFLVLKIPRSTIFHNDKEFRFPTRIGNQTGYLDALGLVAVLNERALVQGEAAQQYVPPGSERPELSETEATSIAHALASPEPSARLEGFRDLAVMASRYVMFTRKPVAEAAAGALESGTDQERDLLMQALRNRSVWNIEDEVAIMLKWVPQLAALAARGSPELAITSFQTLVNLRRKEAVEVLVQWVVDADDERYSKLQPRNLLPNARYFGLHDAYREALYELLEKAGDGGAADRVVSRVPGLLEILRSNF